jgi:3-oxoacyl-[acyl-carrier-protein] synthase-3
MAYLRAFGAYLPPRVVANAEIAARIGKTAEWVVEVSGIQQRRWADPAITVADLAAAAGSDCLRRAEASAADVGMVIVASGSSERRFPGPAAETALKLGLGAIPALDVPIASAGSLFGLSLAVSLAERYGNILVIGAEKVSAIIESAELDANTAILFGDGAGACLVSASEGAWRVVDFVLHSDGSFATALQLPLAGALAMEGLTVIMQASRKIPSAIQEVLVRAGRTAAELDHFVIHQANLNLIVRVARALKVPEQRFFSNIVSYGNTSSASMLIAAAEAELSGRLLCLASFGAGFHWGAMLAERVSASQAGK